MDYKTPRFVLDEARRGRRLVRDAGAAHTIFQQPHADVLGEVLAEVLREADVEAREGSRLCLRARRKDVHVWRC